MKIIHTSDWHLGQNFFNQSRKHEHQAFLDWLLNQVKEHQVDAIIVSGDIFDIGTPPSYAREMLNQFVVSINKLNCTLILVAGNHDSVATLNESKQLMAYLNTHVITHATEDIKPQLIPIKNKKNIIQAYLCAVPFLRPRDIISSQEKQRIEDKQRVLTDAIKAHYTSLYTYALEKRDEDKNPHAPIIMTGHLTALGISKSESVRDIYIGTLDGFDASGFPNADYIALGHIHRPQKVAKKDHIRYSGSPINLSFDELTHKKQVVLINFDNQSTQITPISVPCFQPMQKVKGSLAEVEEELNTLLHEYRHEHPVWLNIEITAQSILSDLQDKIQEIIKDKPALVLQIKRTNMHTNKALTTIKNETLTELTPEDVFTKRLLLEEIPHAEKDEYERRNKRITEIFKRLTDEIRTQQTEDLDK